VDGTGSGLCPVVGFVIGDAEPSDSATRVLVIQSLSQQLMIKSCLVLQYFDRTTFAK
jgi:hypothetical protein